MEKRIFKRIIVTLPIQIKIKDVDGKIKIINGETSNIGEDGLGILLTNSSLSLHRIANLTDTLYINILGKYPLECLPINILWSNYTQEEEKTLYGVKFVNLNDGDAEAINKILVEYSKKKFTFEKTIKENIVEVFNILKNFQDFPKFMRDVKNVKIIETKGKRIIIEWEIEIDGAPIYWKEEDEIDEEKKSIKFKMLEGDYGSYEGEWQLKKIDEQKTKLIFYAGIDWGIPTFEKFVGKTLEIKTRKSLRSMVNSIKKESENNG